MKTRRIVLIFSLILCLGMLVACNADVAEQNAGDKLAYATFKNDAKEFSVSYDGYKSFDDLFWYYKAHKLDDYGQSGDTGNFYAKVPGNTQGKGLDGKTEPLSEGKWQFTLMAFENALSETETGSKRYNADASSASAIYSGSTPATATDPGVIVIRRNQTNYIPVTVTPVAGTGHIKFGDTESQPPKTAYYEWEEAGSGSNPDVKITITLPVKTGETVKNYVITKELVFSENKYPISGYIWLNSTTTTGTIAGSTPGDDYTNDIPAGVYAASIVITPVDDEDNIIFADQNLSLKVFGGLTATIKGSLKELLSYENYFAVPEVDVKVFNPTTTSETVITSTYVAKDDKTTEEKTKVTFPADALTSTNQHSLEIEVFSAAVSESKFVATTTDSQAVAGLDLTLTKVTRTSEGDVTEETVSEFDNNAYATIVTYINAGLEDVFVKYNGDDKDQPIATDDTFAEDKTKAEVLSSDSGLGYNPGSGYLSFKTNHFSEYYVQAKVYAQNVTTSKYYHSLQAAIDDAQDGQTIKVCESFTQDKGFIINKNLKLDTNGKTITVTSGSNCNNRAFRIDRGTFEVYGNGKIVAEGTGTTAATGAGCYGAFRIESNGNLVASNLTLTNARPWGLNVKVLGGTANLTNVAITSSYGGGIEVSEADLGTHSKTGFATLTNCTFSQTDYYDHCSTPLSVSGGSELIVNGGTYTSANHVLYVFSSGGVITVNNGTFNKTEENDHPGIIASIDTNTYPQYTGGLIINDGDFTCNYTITPIAYMSITGGTFDHDPTAYVAPGYYADATIIEGKWVVMPTNSEVSVTNGTTTVYMTLSEFRDSVNSGNSYEGYTVTLLKDVNLNNAEWTPIGTEEHPFKGVFDGANHTIRNLTVTSHGMYSGLFGFVDGGDKHPAFGNAEGSSIGQRLSEVYNSSSYSMKDNLLTETIIESNYGAVIKNVNISGFAIDCANGEDIENNGRYSGSLVGYAKSAFISNCDVSAGTVTGCKVFGGVVGVIGGSAVIDCNTSSDVTVATKGTGTGEGYNFGGIIGATSYRKDTYGYNAVINCANNATLNHTVGTSGGYMAGIIGFSQNNDWTKPSFILGCTNNGSLIDTVGSNVSGIASGCVNVQLIVNCTNTDDFSQITGSGEYLAGIIDCLKGNNLGWTAINCSCTNELNYTGTHTYTHSILARGNDTNYIVKECSYNGSPVEDHIPNN